jgi:subtilisin family serine protease
LAVLVLAQSGAVSKRDGYYLIYVNNTYSEGNGMQKRQEFVGTVMEEIQNLIEENKSTFKNPENLETLKENNVALKKRNNSGTSYVHEVSSLDDTTVLSSYFSYEVNEKVKHLPGILGSEPKRRMSYGVPDESIFYINRNKSKRDFVDDVPDVTKEENIEDTLMNIYLKKVQISTGWKNIGVRENADLHLSVMSKGYFNGTNDQYDTNYYFPKPEGQGIDIYVIDSGFNFRHPEFSNKEDRQAKCLGIISNGEFFNPEAEDFCISNNIHGELTSDCVAGIKHGVASKANIYGIGLTVEGREGEENNNENFLLSLDYILKNIKMEPHKSIISLSMGGFFSLNDTEFYNYMQKIFKKFSELGVITFVSAGNGGRKVVDVENDAIYLPCALDDVICVGAIDTNGSDRDPTIPDELYYSKKMDPINYFRAYFSNYGEQVKIYGPGYAYAEFQDWENNVENLFAGTSFTTPLVAGVAATIMSEHTEIDFDTQSMAEYLISNGHKNILGNIPEGENVFINNGNKVVLIKNNIEEKFYEEENPIENIDENPNDNIEEMVSVEIEEEEENSDETPSENVVEN